MLKIKTTLGDGRILIMLGLSQLNLDKLRAGQPIFFDVGPLQIAKEDELGAVAIFYGSNEGAMMKELTALGLISADDIKLR